MRKTVEEALAQASRQREATRERQIERVRAEIRQSLRPPNWEGFWRHLSEASLHELIALSLEWEPNQYGLSALPEFNERLALACRFSSTLSPTGLPGDLLHRVKMSVFACWALSVNMDLPDYLAARAESLPPDLPVARYSKSEAQRANAAYRHLKQEGKRISASAIARHSGLDRSKVSAMVQSKALPPDAVQQRRKNSSKPA